MATLPIPILAVLFSSFLFTGCKVGVDAVVEDEGCQADRPYTSSMSIETYEETPIQGEFDIWDDGSSPLAYEILSSPWGGYLQLYEGSASFTYWPSPGFVGEDYITYQAFNYSGTSKVSTIAITVWPIEYTPN